MYWWNQPGGMGYDGGGWFWGMAIMHGLVWLVLLVLIVVAVLALIRYLWRSGSHAHHGHMGTGAGTKSALGVLEERYARGEIDREEYMQKKQDLS